MCPNVVETTIFSRIYFCFFRLAGVCDLLGRLQSYGRNRAIGKIDFYMPVDQCRFDDFVSYVILDDKAGPENFYVHIVGFDNEWLIFFVEDFEIGLPVEPDFSFFIGKPAGVCQFTA